MGCQYFCLRRPVYFLSRPMVVFFRVIRITLMDHCWLYICFYRATLNTGRSSREKGVCLSVRLSDRLSNVWLVTKKEEKSVQILYHTKDHYLVFWEKNGWWGVTTSTWNFGSNWPRWSEVAHFQSIFARSASAVTPSEKSSINTNTKSTTRFPMSLRHLKKVYYKVSLCENCQRQSCKAFIGLTIRAKMIGGGDPFYLKFWVKLTALERNRPFSVDIRS